MKRDDHAAFAPPLTDEQLRAFDLAHDQLKHTDPLRLAEVRRAHAEEVRLNELGVT